jgi:mRNA-degrading endonuclease toxin of MazEF toxin-antitoxin module
MPNTTGYSFGDVVLVPFPFTDQTASKKRPAVVVSADAYHQRRPDVIVMAVTSQILRSPGALGEVLISDWQAGAHGSQSNPVHH